MSANPTLIDYFTKRRSVTLPFLAEPGPNAEELTTILEIGMRVPDHGKLAPWRLVIIGGEKRVEAGEMLAQIAAENRPNASAEELEIERKQFLPAPLTIMVVSTAAIHPKVPEVEQFLSAGCVALNLVHGANAFGYAAQWITRWFAFDERAKRGFGVAPEEQIVGFVHIGTPEIKPEERDRPQAADIVSTWAGPSL